MYLLFDIGGTNTRIAISRDKDEIEDKRVFQTPETYTETLERVSSEYKSLADDMPISYVVGGAAGVFDKSQSKLIRAPHIKDFENKNIKSDLEELFHTHVKLMNDTDLAGLGEAVYGAGRGYEIVAYLTISTGIGGSRIINQKVDKYTYGFEPGHQIIDADGSICPECRAFEDDSGLGHWEALSSGAGVKKRFKVDASDLDDLDRWDEIAELISIGLNNTIVYWSPDVIVLGGGLMQSKYLGLEKLKDKLSDRLHIFPKLPDIKLTELGKYNTVYGALAHLRQITA